MKKDNKTIRRILLTGASSGIGLALLKELIEKDYYVYGIGRNFSACLNGEGRLLPQFDEKRCTLINFDLSETGKLPDMIKSIIGSVPVDILINNAGVAYYGNHETIAAEHIEEMVTVNLTVPMILSKLVLPAMKQKGSGMIVNISSVTAKSNNNTHGCAYGATKAGLSSFGMSLFEEARKSGVKVMNIHPDLTDTALYRNADLLPGVDNDAHLEAEEIAKMTVDSIDEMYRIPGLNISDITLRPLKNVIQKKQKN